MESHGGCSLTGRALVCGTSRCGFESHCGYMVIYYNEYDACYEIKAGEELVAVCWDEEVAYKIRDALAHD